MSHPQAYFRASAVIAASPSLDDAALDRLSAAFTGDDAFTVTEVDGLGMVAARTVDGFTHAVVGIDGVGIALWDAPFWRTEEDDVEDLDTLEAGPLDLARACELLADAPAGIAEELLDAVRDGPAVLVEPDAQRRAAWITWVTHALPPAPLTFTTGPPGPDVRLTVTDRAGAGAIDATQPSTAQPSLYARAAVAIARRDPAALPAAVAGAPDGLTLAVVGGATEVLAPADLPRALELITDLASGGDVATAARAAAALPGPYPYELPPPVEVEEAPEPVPARAVFEVVKRETPPALEVEVLREPEPEPPPIAEVIEDVEVVLVEPWVEAEVVEAPPSTGASLEELMASFQAALIGDTPPEADVVAEPEPVAPEPEPDPPAVEPEPSPAAAAPDVVPTQPERTPRPAEPEVVTEPEPEPVATQPEPTPRPATPPVVDEPEPGPAPPGHGRTPPPATPPVVAEPGLEAVELAPSPRHAQPEVVAEPEPPAVEPTLPPAEPEVVGEPEPETVVQDVVEVEESFGEGVSLKELEASLAPVVDEEVGMSLGELEEALKRDAERFRRRPNGDQLPDGDR